MLEVLDLNAWEGISELAPRRQLDKQEHAGAFQQQPTAVDHVLALAHRLPRGTVDRVPKAFDRRMGGAPLKFELLHLGVAKAVRLEFPPSIQAALVAEGQIADFADFALRRVGGEGPVRDAEDLAGRDAVSFIARILGRIEATVGIELPLLVADPSKDPGFDA